jgi:hypothetical protein
MNSIEDQVRAATRAEASALREVRSLRLPPRAEPRPAARWRRPGVRRPRRWRLWLAPVTAAALVVALASSLVIIRDSSNGRVVHPTGPAPVAGGVPPYYVTLYRPPAGKAPVPCTTESASCTSAAPAELLVGNTLTGATVATVSPPTGATFHGVTGAADDRTFVVDTISAAGPSGDCFARTFYLLKITPGAAPPARLRKLPIPRLACVDAIALSESGRELAVAGFAQRGSLSLLQIYSVTTGKLLRAWSTRDRAVFETGTDVTDDLNRGLGWVDGDRAVAFPSMQSQALGTQVETLRTVDVTSGGGELIEDSRVVWSMTSSPDDPDPSGCEPYQTQLISGNGQTVVCISIEGPGSWGSLIPAAKLGRFRLAWLAYSASVPKAAPRTLYSVTSDAPILAGFRLGELWTNASGSVVIGYRSAWNGRVEQPELFGVIGGGAFRPLPTPPTIRVGSPSAIAW